jgi:hypothetical protein
MPTDYLIWTFKVIAGLGGAIIGYFLAGPVVRLLYRGAFHQPAPGGAIFAGKIGGAALIGVLFFFLVGLGGNFGFGSGGGGGDGTGNNGNGSSEKKSADHQGNDKKDPSPEIRQVLEIELLGGNRYKDDQRFFLLHRNEPAVTFKEVEQYFEENKNLEVHIIIRSAPEMSVSEDSRTVMRLRKLADKYKFPHRIENVP